MTEPSFASRFEENRSHLASVAYRMLGNREDAEDAVQETWVRLNRSDTSDVVNLRGWLTKIVARICLDILRSRKSRREDELDPEMTEPEEGTEAVEPNAEDELVLAESVGLALTVVLDSLAPDARVALVLHDLFDFSFEEVARVVGKSPAAARQLASRARRQVRQQRKDEAGDRVRQRKLVEAFLAASRDGNLLGLLELLAPDVVLAADPVAVRMGSSPEVRGAAAVAATFKGRALAARLALIDGVAGLVWSHGGEPRVVFTFAMRDGKIARVELVADRDHWQKFELRYLEAER